MAILVTGGVGYIGGQTGAGIADLRDEPVVPVDDFVGRKPVVEIASSRKIRVAT